MYVLICPCVLNAKLRANGITSDKDLEVFSRVIERCQKFNVEIVTLPCPETIYLGTERAPGTFLERLNTPDFFSLLATLEQEVRTIIHERGPPLCILGVNSSPTCGVDTTYFGSTDGTTPEKIRDRGVFLKKFPELAAVDVTSFAKYRIYLAAPLFSEAEKWFNCQLYEILTGGLFEVYLPQEIGDDTHTRDTSAHARIFKSHMAALHAADAVVAVIDGPDADSGTSWEMGYASALGKPVVAIRTDFRMAGHHELVNLMLEQSSVVVGSKEEVVPALQKIFGIIR